MEFDLPERLYFIAPDNSVFLPIFASNDKILFFTFMLNCLPFILSLANRALIVDYKQYQISNLKLIIIQY